MENNKLGKEWERIGITEIADVVGVDGSNASWGYLKANRFERDIRMGVEPPVGFQAVRRRIGESFIYAFARVDSDGFIDRNDTMIVFGEISGV